MDIISLIFFIIFLLVLASSVYANIKLFLKVREMLAMIVELRLENTVLRNHVITFESEKSIEKTDGFLKFVTESRNWAFEYIENAQESIQSLKTAVESGYPTEEAMKKLFDLLPENNKENNNE